MNYEEMSDFEINKLVVLAIDSDGDIESVTQRKSKLKCISNQALVKIKGIDGSEPFNACNNPSDAWNIIVENNISMLADSNYELERNLQKFKLKFTGRYIASAFPVMGDGYNGGELQVVDKNPLRAAMICFLKMKDAENE